MRITTALVFLLASIASIGQVAISPYISAGYAEHLKFNGPNLELGIESEFFQRADITLNYRYMNADKELKVSAISANISYVFINSDNHRLMLGPGFSYGSYKRSTGTPGYDKDYTSTWFDWCKIRYDYTLYDRYRLGLITSLYGDDGDGTFYEPGVTILANARTYYQQVNPAPQHECKPTSLRSEIQKIITLL